MPVNETDQRLGGDDEELETSTEEEAEATADSEATPRHNQDTSA
jgi:hypothetical protein